MSEKRGLASLKINAELVVRLRKEKSWSQDELAIASGLNVRTIQRIESEATASLQSKKALASALEIRVQDLDREEMQMSRCPVCKSEEIYQYTEYFRYTGANNQQLLPYANDKVFLVAKIRPSVCLGCGHIWLFASEEARKKIKASKHWKSRMELEGQTTA